MGLFLTVREARLHPSSAFRISDNYSFLNRRGGYSLLLVSLAVLLSGVTCEIQLCEDKWHFHLDLTRRKTIALLARGKVHVISRAHDRSRAMVHLLSPLYLLNSSPILEQPADGWLFNCRPKSCDKERVKTSIGHYRRSTMFPCSLLRFLLLVLRCTDREGTDPTRTRSATLCSRWRTRAQGR